MSVDVARASLDWLTLREPADASARSEELVDLVFPLLPSHTLVIHDLGCGTGSMRRWLAPRLPQKQHWIEHDRDVDLLVREEREITSSAGEAVTFETRDSDITRIPADTLRGAGLLTASALLDMFTEDELDRFVRTCSAASCPSLLTLSVVGRVAFDPADELDAAFMEAFNDHQRRRTDHGTLLGPDAAHRAVELLEANGAEVMVRSSPWQLDASTRHLLEDWFAGWIEPACEQRPDLRELVGPYSDRRNEQAAAGRLRVQVHHVDILAVPR